MKAYTMKCGHRHVELNNDGTVMVRRDASPITTTAQISLDDPAALLDFAKAVIAQSREAERAKLVAALAETSTVFLAANSARNAAAKALDEFDGKRRA